VRYRICHRTSYGYGTPVFESFNQVRLQPLGCTTQSVLDFDLRIEPPASVIAFRDYYGNSVHDFGVSYLHDRLVIEATSDVVTYAQADEPLLPEVDSQPDASPPVSALADGAVLQDDFAEFLGPSAYIVLGAETNAIAQLLLAEETASTALRFLDMATDEVRRRLEYRIGTTTVDSSVAEVLAGGAGVCQDFAHVLISICRHAGLPARYVSGYLGGIADATASHAWVEAYLPPYGWVGVDATLGQHCTGKHVKTGVGRDYADVTVLRGTYQGGSRADLDVRVTCDTLGSDDRVSNLRANGDETPARLMAFQNLGAMRRFQQDEVFTQTVGGTRHVLSDDLPLPPPRSQTRTDDGKPSQQPHQQQQFQHQRHQARGAG
jgi:transglutaminase-like putative cysteine protease